ncbi:Capsule synthesis positive regulator AcpB [Jeotgalibaca dankookensis]|uniref:Capsule synthesis positive regulator AcpB n=1 Tax=Jeotgalibaca dankookensis TaxID=708126 RepID=A0A1S6IM49_9LACT|nr:helix-turn-helix domain-containing protein [Jeotgalibaca dankookensis]AQS52634.1 Capsule synthesis positive regulator AcpB [Jeotgalibaca dankookensis]
MFSLISDKDKRKFKILSYLFQANEPVTIAFLAKETSSSVRTVQYDLNELKITINDLGGEIKSSPNGISLNLPFHVGMDYFQRQLYKTSPGFNLLELIFFNETYYDDELAELLFTSSATLCRLIAKVRLALNEYGLDLSSQPFKVVGNEMLIRNFYATYFAEAYNINEWPFPDVSRKFLTSCINSVIDYHELSDNLYEFHKFRFRHAVEISRAKKGYFIEEVFIESTETRQSQYSAFMLESKEISQRLNLSHEELTIYFSQIINWKFYFSLPFLKERIQSNPVAARRYHDFLETITFLTEIFQIPKRDHTYLIFELNNILELYSLYPIPASYRNFFLFDSQSAFLLTTFREKFPIFYEIAKKKFIHILKKQNLYLNDAIIEKLLFVFLSKWPDLYYDLNLSIQSLDVLVYSHQHTSYTKFIIDILESKFNKFISFKKLEHPDICAADLSHLNFDILITSVSLNIEIPQPIFFLYPYNMTGSFNNFEKLINEVSQIKKENRKQKILSQLSKRKEFQIE